MTTERLVRPHSWPSALRATLLAGAAAAALLLAIPPLFQRGEAASTAPALRVAPYRLPVNLAASTDVEIAFYKDRVSREPQPGLDMAFLAQAYLKKARTTGEVGWYLLADQAARRSLANLPVYNDGARMVLAHVAESQHDFPTALRLADQVLRAGRRPEDALSVHVTSMLALGRVAEAGGAADLLVKLATTVATLTQRALVEQARGQEQAAIRDLQQAIAIEQPEEAHASAAARMYLGRIHCQRGRYALARALYEEALRIHPQSHLVLGLLADLEVRTGQLADAERHYGEAITLFPQASYMQGLARTKELQGDSAAARQQLVQAETMLRRELSNGSFGHRRSLAILLLERGRPGDNQEALALMRAELRIRKDAATWDTLAWALAANHQLPEARQAMQQALHWGQRDADMLYRAGTIEAGLGNTSQAHTYFAAALLANPSFEQAAQARRNLSGRAV